MKTIFKRFGAYIIDMLIVVLISLFISNICSSDYQLDNYKKNFDKAIKLTEKLEKEKITEKEYKKEYRKLNYELDKSSTTTSFVLIACMIGYFGIFQYSQNGKTVGKRLFKLQVKKNDDGDLNIGNYLLRSFILYNIVFTLTRLALIYTLKQNDYMNYRDILSNVQTIVTIIIVVSIFFSKEGRGLHDLIAGTKVEDLKINNEFKKGTKKVVEGEIIK